MGDQWLELRRLLLMCVCVCVCVFIKLHITAQPGSVKLIFQCYSNGSAPWGISVCVCVCVCVHHINRSAPNLMIIHLEKTKCGCRSGPWSAGQGGERKTKRSRPGVQTAINECENNSPRKASETIIDTNGREREPGGRSRRCTRYIARRAMEKQLL